MNVLVIGGTGLVGNTLLRLWKKRGVEIAATCTRQEFTPNFYQLDIRDAEAVASLIAKVSPRLVALPASNPYVDYCELNPAETWGINVQGSLNVARASRDAGIPMVFFSSDYVFDGRKGAYVEEDALSPLNEYGRQKADVESALLRLNPRNLIIRTSGVYGWEQKQKNFVLQVRRKLGAGERMSVPDDIIYCPTYAENLAQVITELCHRGEGGLYHVAGAEAVSKFEFAKHVARIFRLDESLIGPVPSDSFKSPAIRPKRSVLKTGKIERLGLVAWGFKQGLEHMAASEDQWKQEVNALFPLPVAV